MPPGIRATPRTLDASTGPQRRRTPGRAPDRYGSSTTLRSSAKHEGPRGRREPQDFVAAPDSSVHLGQGIGSPGLGARKRGKMRLVRRQTREAAKPREDRLALPDGKARESVRTPLGNEGGEYLGRRRDELRGKNGRKEVDEGFLRAGRKMTDGRDHEAGRQIARVNAGLPFRQREAAARTGWAQQEHVV